MDRQEEQIAHELETILPATLHKTAPQRRFMPNLPIRHPQALRPITMDTTRFGVAAYLLRAVLMWSMHSDQSSSITSVSASLSALRNVRSTGAGCFFLSSALIIATPFLQSDL